MRVNSTSRRLLDPREGRATAPSPSVRMLGVCCARIPPRPTSSHRRGQVSDPDQVIGGEREREPTVQQRGASMALLPHQAHRLQPTKDLLYPLALPLADLVSGMARGATIDCAPTPRGVLGHVRSHPVLAHSRDEGIRVESFVTAQGASAAARDVFDQEERRIPFRGACGLGGAATDGKTISVLHDDVSQVGQLCFVATSLAVQSRLRISRRLVSVVRPLLAPEIHGRITGIVPAVASRRVLSLEALPARPGLDQSAVHGEVLVGEKTDTRPLGENLLQEDRRHVALEQPRSVLRERLSVPDPVVEAQAHEPTEEDVVVEVLDELALATKGVKHLKDKRSEETFRRNRRPPGARVQPLKPARTPCQSRIPELPDPTPRVVLRHTLRGRDVAEHRLRLLCLTSHSPLLRYEKRTITQGHGRPFSASC